VRTMKPTLLTLVLIVVALLGGAPASAWAIELTPTAAAPTGASGTAHLHNGRANVACQGLMPDTEYIAVVWGPAGEPGKEVLVCYPPATPFTTDRAGAGKVNFTFWGSEPKAVHWACGCTVHRASDGVCVLQGYAK
jgi:hypothetical protein